MRSRALLSIQRALLGEVFPALRAVTIEWQPDLVKFYAYVDGAISDEDAESMSCVSAEVAADFSASADVDHEVIRLDAPRPIGDARTWVFKRREET
jgi:hypothetical protein